MLSILLNHFTSGFEISDAGSRVYFCRLHSGGEENGVIALRGAGERSCRASGVCAQCKPAGRCEDCQLYVVMSHSTACLVLVI